METDRSRHSRGGGLTTDLVRIVSQMLPYGRNASIAIAQRAVTLAPPMPMQIRRASATASGGGGSGSSSSARGVAAEGAQSEWLRMGGVVPRLRMGILDP